MELKRINWEAGQFEANGKVYYIESRLSVERWIEWRKQQIELSFSLTFEELMRDIRKAYDLINAKDSKIVEAGIVLYNLMHGIKKIGEGSIPEVIRLAALFLNTKDEDRTHFSDALVKEKMNDWSAEGIAMDDFFAFAISTIPNFIKHYEAAIRDFSEQTSEVSQGVLN